MEPRVLIAYGLMALIAAVIAFALLRARYNSHHRKVMRERRRERETYEQHMAEREVD